MSNTLFFYVVTRNGRRVEPHDYMDADEARSRALILMNQVKQWDPNSPNKIEVIKTSQPINVR